MVRRRSRLCCPTLRSRLRTRGQGCPLLQEEEEEGGLRAAWVLTPLLLLRAKVSGVRRQATLGGLVRPRPRQGGL